MINLKVDGRKYKVDVDPNKPILWVLREHLNLTHTKFGCGVAQCGACTVLLDNESIRSCSTPISMADNKSITTVSNKEDNIVKNLQKAWVEEDVAQCGYCQPGQIMNAASLLKSNPNPTEEEIVAAMDGNICRCGTYNKIKTAIKKASKVI
ncbi:(2Fe-2S)-binding protein [Arcobacter sp. CECT 8989]|uniref:(2Fe-2S)-binding protein n=1 Tax=Arcobacter sp. CECT 8989 TaxID=2044509 RepID=UPI002159D2BD|nr:(2Fe-2S)-binding protein [Arcobacter sp. CECT 8989]